MCLLKIILNSGLKTFKLYCITQNNSQVSAFFCDVLEKGSKPRMS